jgi:hypothetical protein
MSLKQLHREIMLSAAYQMSTEFSSANFAKDGENRYLWRFNRRRLDAEALRDSILAVSGTLDRAQGGPSTDWTDDNHRRSVYGSISRFGLNPYLGLFDFPDPASSSEQRSVTMVPQQRLFFMNSGFVTKQAASLAQTLQKDIDTATRVREVYRRVLDREPSDAELRLGLEFIGDSSPGTADDENLRWREYARTLLSCNEFSFLN